MASEEEWRDKGGVKVKLVPASVSTSAEEDELPSSGVDTPWSCPMPKSEQVGLNSFTVLHRTKGGWYL